MTIRKTIRNLYRKLANGIGCLVAYGRGARRDGGRGVLTQARDIWSLNRELGFRAEHYYRWKLYRPERLERAGEWVPQWRAEKAFDCSDPKGMALLKDKVAFARLCRESGLSHIDILAVFDGGAAEFAESTTSANLLGTPLFAKPRGGGNGKGVRRWFWKDGAHIDEDGSPCSESEVVEALCGLSLSTPYVLQRCLANHPTLEEIAKGALASIRVVTLLSGDSNCPRVALPLLLMPGENALVSNYRYHGLIAGIDPETGTLGGAMANDARIDAPPIKHHPRTGAPILGTRLPFWNEVLELAVSAHKRFPGVVVVGWDLAITEHGPVLIEGNGRPSMELPQNAHDQPLTPIWPEARHRHVSVVQHR